MVTYYGPSAFIEYDGMAELSSSFTLDLNYGISVALQLLHKMTALKGWLRSY